MYRSFLPAPILLAGSLLDPTGLAGQALERTKVFEIAPYFAEGVGYDYDDPGALAFDGGFAVYWSTTFSGEDGEAFDAVQGRLLDAGGRLGAWLKPDSALPAKGNYVGFPSITRESSGDFLFAWDSGEDDYLDLDVWTQRFHPSGEPAEPLSQRLNTWEPDAFSPVTAAGGGVSVIAWMEDDNGPGDTELKAVVFGPGGETVTGELLVDSFHTSASNIAVGVDAGGRFVILWWKGGGECSLAGQRFAPDGTPLGGRFTIAETVDTVSGVCWLGLAMAMAPDGSFAAAWEQKEDSVRLQRFRPQGTPESAAVDFEADSYQTNYFALAGDRHGNLALMRPQGIQMLNRQMVRQGPLLAVGPLVAPWMEGVALGDRLLAVWNGPRIPGDSPAILGRIWDVRRDADATIYRGNRFLFDTAGDGGEPDVIIPFGSGQGIPLLGDYNGDGRDDPCLYRDGRFLCDTAHDGGLAEKQSRAFGKPGDVPLLGDFDGDGRDDPCVRRGKTFLCDADRNGKADRSITFGQPGDQVVIGDVDGDGRGDPCVVRKGVFLCDSAHNGGGAETLLSLGSVLTGLPEGTPALGDMNGDGRDDPCVFTDGRLLCGLFPKGAKLPASIIDRPFGEPGDVLLLGDLDAF